MTYKSKIERRWIMSRVFILVCLLCIASRAFNGWVVKYQFGEIFISPAETDAFLSALQSVKPSIKINC